MHTCLYLAQVAYVVWAEIGEGYRIFGAGYERNDGRLGILNVRNDARTQQFEAVSPERIFEIEEMQNIWKASLAALREPFLYPPPCPFLSSSIFLCFHILLPFVFSPCPILLCRPIPSSD